MQKFHRLLSLMGNIFVVRVMLLILSVISFSFKSGTSNVIMVKVNISSHSSVSL